MSLQPQPTKLDCGCLVLMHPKGTAFIPKCGTHVRAPEALATLVEKIRAVGKLDARDVPAPTPAPAREGYTYSGNPGASLLDQVRFLLGDTDPLTAYLTDGEILWLLTDAQDNALNAAYRGTDSIIAKLARNRDESVGSVSIAFSQQLAGYEKLAGVLKRRMSRGAIPFAGGISRTQKLVERSDGDRVQPSFIRDLDQYPDRPEDYTYGGLRRVHGARAAVGGSGGVYGSTNTGPDDGSI